MDRKTFEEFLLEHPELEPYYFEARCPRPNTVFLLSHISTSMAVTGERHTDSRWKQEVCNMARTMRAFVIDTVDKILLECAD